MKTLKTNVTIFIVVLTLLATCTSNLNAQEEKTDSSLFSHKGVKASIAYGMATAASDLNLKTGNVFSLSFGYGFTNNLSFWLSYGRAKHQNKTGDMDAVFTNPVRNNQYKADLQYKFITDSRLQPYGKVGWGVYGLREKDVDVTKIGTGFAFAVGADYFFSRNFGFGVEVNYKFLNYTEESRKVGDDDWQTFDLDPALNGNSLSVVLTFTIQ